MEYYTASQIFLFGMFLQYVHVSHGIQPSISDSWYALGKKGFMFTLLMFSLGSYLFIVGSLSDNLLLILGGSCLSFVGAATRFKEKLEGTVHVIGAVGGIGLCLAGLAAEGVIFPVATFALASAIIHLFRVKNHTWWIEIIAFVCCIVGILNLNI